MAKIFVFKRTVINVLLPLGLALALSLSSCGSENEPTPEPEPDKPAEVSVEGIWECIEGITNDFIKFDKGNICFSYGGKNSNIGKRIYVDRGYYTIDTSKGYFIHHFSYSKPNSGVSIYKIDKLTSTEFTYRWIEEISGRYHSDSYSATVDLAIIKQFSEQPVTINPDNPNHAPESYVRVTESRLQDFLDSAYEVEEMD